VSVTEKLPPITVVDGGLLRLLTVKSGAEACPACADFVLTKLSDTFQLRLSRLTVSKNTIAIKEVARAGEEEQSLQRSWATRFFTRFIVDVAFTASPHFTSNTIFVMGGYKFFSMVHRI
jgi:hypothetical protein